MLFYLLAFSYQINKIEIEDVIIYIHICVLKLCISLGNSKENFNILLNSHIILFCNNFHTNLASFRDAHSLGVLTF